MRDCSVTGCGLTVLDPDLVLLRVTGDSADPGLPPTMGESDMVTGGDILDFSELFLKMIVS